MEVVNYFDTGNNLCTLLMSMLTRIKSEEYNGKKCYAIKNLITSDLLYSKNKNDIYVEKETGLCVKLVAGDIISEKEYEFDNMGVFEYFREKGTAAYDMKQIPAAIKHERACELEEVQSRVIDKINKRLIGTTLEAIADGADFGRTYKDAPDIDGKVTFTEPVKTGSIFKARVVAAQGYERELEPLS